WKRGNPALVGCVWECACRFVVSSSSFRNSEPKTKNQKPIVYLPIRLVDVVAHVLGQDHEDDILGDVGRVIADSLEVAGDEDQIERRLNRGRILQHEVEEF